MKKITIHNIKSSSFKLSHADGASVGITPTGYFNINFYSQRNVIPKGTIFNIEDNGQLGTLDGVTEDSKEGIIREYDFGIYADIGTCKSIVSLLQEKIKEYEKVSNS